MTFYNLPDTDVKIEYVRGTKKDGSPDVLRIHHLPQGYVCGEATGNDGNEVVVTWGGRHA
jgi:hypothetical protein